MRQAEESVDGGDGHNSRPAGRRRWRARPAARDTTIVQRAGGGGDQGRRRRLRLVETDTTIVWRAGGTGRFATHEEAAAL